MNDHTRRNFLIASGTGAAAIGVVAALPSIAGASTPAATQSPLPTAPDAVPLVAHISDPSSGTLSLLVGDDEVTVHDHDLVTRITAAAKGK
jgi:hypothetical protein